MVTVTTTTAPSNKKAEDRPDRAYRALQYLAGAGDTGMLTSEIVDASGESVNQKTLTWYGNVLRDAVGSGWVTRGGKSPGGWQQPPQQRWHITAAGRQRVLQIREQRAAKTAAVRAEAVALRKRQAAMQAARRTYIPKRSTRWEREQAVLLMRNADVGWGEIARVVQVSIPTAQADFKNAERHWPSPLYPEKTRAQVFGPDSFRLPSIASVLAAESGLTEVQVSGLIRVMWALGMRVIIPERFRADSPERTEGSDGS